MSIVSRLKKMTSTSTSKSANLYQNDDLVSELGYAPQQPEEPIPSPTPQPDGLMSSLSKALVLRKARKK